MPQAIFMYPSISECSGGHRFHVGRQTHHGPSACIKLYRTVSELADSHSAQEEGGISYQRQTHHRPSACIGVRRPIVGFGHRHIIGHLHVSNCIGLYQSSPIHTRPRKRAVFLINARHIIGHLHVSDCIGG